MTTSNTPCEQYTSIRTKINVVANYRHLKNSSYTKRELLPIHMVVSHGFLDILSVCNTALAV